MNTSLALALGLFSLAQVVGCSGGSSEDTNAQAANVSLESQHTEVRNVQEAFDWLEGDAQAQSGQIEALNSTIDTLKVELAAQKSEIESVRQDLAALVESNEAAQAVISENSDAVEALQGEQGVLSGDVQNVIAENEILAEQVTSLASKIDEPRECPVGMVALSGSACVETKVRPSAFLVVAISSCRDAGLRGCSLAEVSQYCDQADLRLEDPFTSTGEWSHSLGGQFEDAKGFRPSWVALGHPTSTVPTTYCESVRVVGTDSSPTSEYPFRCCYDRY